jgi:hypothetical protein
MDLLQGLLVVVAILLLLVLKWLKLIAGSLGCNPHRSEAIQRLEKQLDHWYDASMRGQPTKLTDTEREKVSKRLNDLYDYELFQGPCKAGQGIRIIARLQDIQKLLEAHLSPPSTK